MQRHTDSSRGAGRRPASRAISTVPAGPADPDLAKDAAAFSEALQDLLGWKGVSATTIAVPPDEVGPTNCTTASPRVTPRAELTNVSAG